MRLSELLLENQNPKKFWLVFDIPNWDKNPDERSLALIEDIAKGELHGLKGISGSREILTEWWMVARNAAVMMDADQVMRLNDIEQVLYDDPEYLCSNNFNALFRLWNQNPERKNGKQQMMMRLMQYTVSALKKQNAYLANSLEYYGFVNHVSDAWEKGHSEVQSVADAKTAIYDLVKEYQDGKYIKEGLTFELLGDNLLVALKYVGHIYSSEAEWLVKNDKFKIPEQSTMLIGVDFEIVKNYSDWKANPDKIAYMVRSSGYENYDRLTRIIHEHGFHRRYKIKLVDARKWEEIRPTVTARRRK